MDLASGRVWDRVLLKRIVQSREASDKLSRNCPVKDSGYLSNVNVPTDLFLLGSQEVKVSMLDFLPAAATPGLELAAPSCARERREAGW